MERRSSSFLLTLWFITTLNLPTQVNSGVLIGPDVTSVIPESSTSLNVSWQILTNNSVLEYKVCYVKESSGNVVNCTLNKTAAKNASSLELGNLNIATTYIVAIKVSTAGGLGTFGKNASGTTMDGMPKIAPPSVMVSAFNSTALNITWGKIPEDDANGVIRNYTVCYKLTSNDAQDICLKNKTISGAENRHLLLTDLNEATSYDVKVKARTSQEYGRLSLVEVGITKEAAPKIAPPSVAVSTFNSTALNVTWGKISEDEANGVIRNYTVCYKFTSNDIQDICLKNKTISGAENRQIILTDLNETTSYNISVKASTWQGYGPLSPVEVGITKEAAPKIAPPSVVVSTFNSTALKVTWGKISEDEANGVIRNYTVCYKLTSNDTQDICLKNKTISGAENRQIILTDLNEATSYNISVKARTSQGYGPLSPVEVGITKEAAPKIAPPSVVVSTFNSTALKVTWGKISEDEANGVIRNYTVCYKLTSNDTQDICLKNKTISGAENRQIILTDLNEATSYNISVKARTSQGYGPLSPVEVGITREAAPKIAPPSVMVSSFNSTALNITWGKIPEDDANGVIRNYTVCYKLTSNDAQDICLKNKTISGAENRQLLLTDLNEATSYDFTVKASTLEGYGPRSLVKVGITQEAAPRIAPPSVVVSSFNSTALQVIWGEIPKNDANGVITNYTVCYQLTENATHDICFKNITINGSENRKVFLTDLNEATSYNVTVKARTSIGYGPSSAIKLGKTGSAKPRAGPMVEVTTKNATSLNVLWDELTADDANGIIEIYTICYKPFYSNGDICSKNKNITGTANRAVTLTGLNEATLYYVAVKASTSVGFGPLGPIKNGTTNESTPARGPTIKNVSSPSSKSLNVSWEKLSPDDANGAITKYLVCYQEHSVEISVNCVKNKSIDDAATSAILSNLNEATNYDIAITAATSKGFGPPGLKSSGKTLEDKPNKGPNITTIEVKSSKSLEVSWNTLSLDNANGELTNFTICYQLKNIIVFTCNMKETVNGDVTKVLLKELDIYTEYNVWVKAATKAGFGPSGQRTSQRTGEGSPSKPKKLSVTKFFSSIDVSWEKPEPANGIITVYEVCYDDNCKNVTQTVMEITKLIPGTSVAVTVRAYTGAGAGEKSEITARTKTSVLQNFDIANKPGTQTGETQILFNLPKLADAEAREVKSLKVIIQRWSSIVDNNKLKSILNADVKVYESSNDGRLPYVSYWQKGYKSSQLIVIGNGTEFQKQRRKRAVSKYKNAALSPGTEYILFVRAFYDDKENVFINSEVLRLRTKKEKTTSDSTTIIVIIIVVIIIALIVAVFVVLLMRRKRSPYESAGDIEIEPIKVRYPVPVEEFRTHCERLGMNTGLGYQDEYESIKAKVSVSTETAKLPENIDKNRYNNIHAYDDTRVVLEKIDDEEGSDYINANYIDGYNHEHQFIASQGPIKTTVDDFWRMIWEKDVGSIVMVANAVEKGKEKCAVYWPQDRAVKLGSFMVKLSGEVELADYVIRKMTVTKDDEKESRIVTQFHYTVWPDHGVPVYSTSLQAFLTRIRKSVKEDNKPLLVHCSAGVGRTGTFIGIFAMMDRIEVNHDVDIFNFVCEMRGQRTCMVQVESQYVFLHKAVLETVECGDNEINAADLRLKMNQLNRKDPDDVTQTMMEKQFKVLNQYTFSKNNKEDGSKSFNVNKNRSKVLLPYEDTRVTILKSPGVDGSDYINASFIDSYQKRGMYIATQFPLENTVNDFWRMVWEKKCNCIVMLENVDDDVYCKYWTDKNNDAMLCGSLLVTLDNEEKSDDFITRYFKLKKTDGGETRNIYHFNFLSWREHEIPQNTVGIRQMIGKMQDVQRQCGNNPIIVHCSDGGGRTGAFCAMVTSLERVKQDGSFNLFQTIMLQRIQRPNMVASVVEYKFCFKAILDFLDSFDDYANFQDLTK